MRRRTNWKFHDLEYILRTCHRTKPTQTCQKCLAEAPFLLACTPLKIWAKYAVETTDNCTVRQYTYVGLANPTVCVPIEMAWAPIYIYAGFAWLKIDLTLIGFPQQKHVPVNSQFCTKFKKKFLLPLLETSVVLWMHVWVRNIRKFLVNQRPTGCDPKLCHVYLSCQQTEDSPAYFRDVTSFINTKVHDLSEFFRTQQVRVPISIF